MIFYTKSNIKFTIRGTVLIVKTVLLLLMPVFLSAQPHHNVAEVSRAFEFTLGPMFMIGNLNGGAISWKWSGDQSSTNRIGVSVESGLNFTDIESDRHGDTELRNYDIHLRVKADRVHYINPKSKTVFYLGYGPQLGFASGLEERLDNPVYGKVDWKSRLVEAGIGLSAGVEWFVTSSLSLAGEYSVSAMYGAEYDSSTSPSRRIRNNTRFFNFSADVVQLRIAVYFP